MDMQNAAVTVPVYCNCEKINGFSCTYFRSDEEEAEESLAEGRRVEEENCSAYRNQEAVGDISHHLVVRNDLMRGEFSFTGTLFKLLSWVVDLDPNPDWIRIQRLCGSGSVFGIRIRIQGQEN
jgi:hypothetical protein